MVSTHVSALLTVTHHCANEPTVLIIFYLIPAVLHGKPSSSAIIFHGGKPLLMADVGAGVLKSCREKLGQYLPVCLLVFCFFVFFWRGDGAGKNWHVFVCIHLFDSVMFLYYSLCLVFNRFK